MTPSPRPNRRDTNTPIPSDPSFGNIPVDPVKYQLTVRYPGRLRPHRVETVTVSVAPLQAIDPALDVGRKRSMDPIPVRLVIPGAVLLPAEQALIPSPFGTAEAVFHVTAVAEGVLPNCRVEVFRHGKVEAIPLPLRSDSNRTLAWLIALTVVVPLLVFIPACWPDVAESGAIERAVTDWFPASPTSVGRGAQTVYAFLATTGRNLSLSFFTFLGLLGWMAVWAVSRRQTVHTTSNDPFLLLPHSAHAKVGPLPGLLSPVSADESSELR